MTEQTQPNYSRYFNPFNIAYVVSAVVQVIGTWNFFDQIGGGGPRGFFYAMSGAICLESMILALNFYGKGKKGFFRFALVAASLVWISASATIQVMDIRIAKPVGDIVAQLDGFLPMTQVLVAIVPSAAMALITIIKFFGDKDDADVVIDRMKAKVSEQAQVIQDWNQWKLDMDSVILAKDTEIMGLSAKLEESRNRPIVQQLVASNEIQTKVALPEPSQMPIGLMSEVEIDNHLSSPDINDFMRRKREGGMNHNDTVRAALAEVGIVSRNAENAAAYDKRFNRLYARVRRWDK